MPTTYKISTALITGGCLHAWGSQGVPRGDLHIGAYERLLLALWMAVPYLVLFHESRRACRADASRDAGGKSFVLTCLIAVPSAFFYKEMYGATGEEFWLGRDWLSLLPVARYRRLCSAPHHRGVGGRTDRAVPPIDRA